MSDFERLGAFYLGRGYDVENGRTRKDLLLYDAKDLTTHALIVGMTGSGKTGLSVVLLEEAAIDGVPALIIDPKGDMTNLLLTFPGLRSEDFRPWIDESQAAREGITPEEYSSRTAEVWRQGLRKWGQSSKRISGLRKAADLAIYTPGSDAGISLNLLDSFAAPPPVLTEDSDALGERARTAVSGLLGLAGMEADPIHSREHILISTLLNRAWTEGKNLDLASLIRQIQSPPFDQLGVMDLESFFPSKDRLALAMQLNNLLASPAFSSWRKGEQLDIHRLLYTAEGRPRLAIFTMAHLSDAERMFFVTLLLNEVVAWMRTLPGTGSLRALLYMDEIFGYFPPTARPPSKLPMLTLLKQARAYGLGVVLSTQNPVDLDYKGLSNAGTWFIGRLQTARDKARVLDGLEAASAGVELGRQEADALLSRLGKRVFLMHNVHEDEPVVFQTRWALSYLRGPLTRNQIRTLKEASGRKTPSVLPAKGSPTLPAAAAVPADKPAIPSEIEELFLPGSGIVPKGSIYRPALLGTSQLHFVSARAKLDHWQTISMLVALGDVKVDWDEGEVWNDLPEKIVTEGSPEVSFAKLPATARRVKSFDSWSKSFAGYLYRNHRLSLWKSPLLKETSRPGEDEGAFRIRMTQALREKRDREIEKLRSRYAPKLATLKARIEKAQERVSKEQTQYEHQKLQTAISFGATLLGALTGRKLGSARTVGRATTAARSASRAAREKEDIARAKKEVRSLREKLASLEEEFEQKVEKIKTSFDPVDIELEEVSIRPRKSDIQVSRMALAWTLWRKRADDLWEPAY